MPGDKDGWRNIEIYIYVCVCVQRVELWDGEKEAERDVLQTTTKSEEREREGINFVSLYLSLSLYPCLPLPPLSISLSHDLSREGRESQRKGITQRELIYIHVHRGEEGEDENNKNKKRIKTRKRGEESWWREKMFIPSPPSYNAISFILSSCSLSLWLVLSIEMFREGVKVVKERRKWESHFF